MTLLVLLCRPYEAALLISAKTIRCPTAHKNFIPPGAALAPAVRFFQGIVFGLDELADHQQRAYLLLVFGLRH
jgi:hypothetical protein